MALTVLINGVSTGLPAAVYSLTMYAVAFPSVIWLRRWGDGANQAPTFNPTADSSSQAG